MSRITVYHFIFKIRVFKLFYFSETKVIIENKQPLNSRKYGLEIKRHMKIIHKVLKLKKKKSYSKQAIRSVS